tara:strand:+ start:9298 stop:10194 length:897 start_codon:yes stop_codon:yes gene_type:complete
MKTILIGTTSVNRPVLHNDNILEWYNWINALDKTKYNIHWFINIDMIDKLNFSYNETKKNYENIIKDIPITFLQHPENKGNFLKACQRVSQQIEKHVEENNLKKDDVIIFWLEDDWKLHTKIVLDLQYLLETYMSNNCHMNLSFIRANYIHALAPGLINYNLWKKLHLKAWKQQKNHIDPEHCVGKFYLKNFQKNIKEMNNITIINKFKKPGGGFFKGEYLNQKNSYYTYDIEENSNIIKDNYISKKKVKENCNNTITFMRITCGYCVGGVNYGRNFMKKYNLEKKRIQNNNVIDFYN